MKPLHFFKFFDTDHKMSNRKLKNILKKFVDEGLNIDTFTTGRFIGTNIDVEKGENILSYFINSYNEVGRDRNSNDICKYLISTLNADVNAVNKDGFSPLMFSCYYKNSFMTEFLLENGANINHCSNKGRTSLMYAISGNRWDDRIVSSGNLNYELINCLLDYDADPFLVDKDGDTVFQQVCNQKEVLVLLNKRFDLTITTENGENLLMTAAKMTDIDTKSFYYLLKKIDIDAVDNKGNNALMYACDNMSNDSLFKDNLLKRIKFLIKAGINVNARNNRGQTVRDYLEKKSYYDSKKKKEIIKYLEQYISPEGDWFEKITSWADKYSIASEDFPRDRKVLLSLRELFLINNNIDELPPEIYMLSNLTYLNLRNNKLKYLPKEIGKLTKLNDINLANNELSDLPSEFSNLETLFSLNLEGNYFEVFPDILNKLEIQNLIFGKMSRLYKPTTKTKAQVVTKNKSETKSESETRNVSEEKSELTQQDQKTNIYFLIDRFNFEFEEFFLDENALISKVAELCEQNDISYDEINIDNIDDLLYEIYEDTELRYEFFSKELIINNNEISFKE